MQLAIFKFYGALMNILRLFFDLCLHILFGTLLFCVVGIAAVGLGLFVNWAEANGLAHELVFILRTLEYVVYVVDALLYLAFILTVGLEFVFALWERLIDAWARIRRRRDGNG
jgi:hypothetical protein